MSFSNTSARDTRAFDSLAFCIEVVSRAESEAQLLDEMCGLLVERVGYRMAWVGFREDDEVKSVRVAAKAGVEEGYLENIDIRWSDEPRGRGPTGTAIRTRRKVVVQDISTDINFAPWKEEAARRGYLASAALPLISGAELLGVLNLYSTTPNAFEVEDLRLLELMAANLATGILSLRRRRAQEQSLKRLRAKREMLQAIFDTSPDMIFLHDSTGKVIDVNASMLLNYGVEREAVIGTIPVQLVGVGNSSDEALGLLSRAIQGEDLDFEWIAKGHEGDFPVEVRLRRLHLQETGDDEPAVLALVRDLRDQKAAESERIKVEKLRSLELMAGGVAHDFNNLLTALLGNLSLIAQEELEPDDQKLLHEVELAAERAAGLTQQLLLFSRESPSLEPRRVEKLVEATMTFALRGSAVALDFRAEANLRIANIDANQVSHVLHNLALNSVQAMGEGGTLRVRVSNIHQPEGNIHQLSDGDYIHILVNDDGPGVPDAIADKIFDPYFTTKEGGTGLGLATAFNTLRRGGGHLSLQRHEEAPLHGATFEIFLPTTDSLPLTAVREPKEDPDATLLKILVMDDEDQVRRYIARSLDAIGCDVTTVANGDEALAVFQEHSKFIPFDLVILDMTIPGGHGGNWTLQRLLRIDPTIKVIAISGYTIESTREELLSQGFCDFIPKPMKPQVLWRAVRAIANVEDGAQPTL